MQVEEELERQKMVQSEEKVYTAIANQCDPRETCLPLRSYGCKPETVHELRGRAKDTVSMTKGYIMFWDGHKYWIWTSVFIQHIVVTFFPLLYKRKHNSISYIIEW